MVSFVRFFIFNVCLFWRQHEEFSNLIISVEKKNSFECDLLGTFFPKICIKLNHSALSFRAAQMF
jgi:hypothetical protein